MDRKWIGVVPLLLVALAISPNVLAQEEQEEQEEVVAGDDDRITDQGCPGNNQWAYVAGMGWVNDDRLQEHVDEMQAELENGAASLPRSRQQRKSMERHLVNMQEAMGEMQETVADGTCGATGNAAPVDQRVQALEQRLDNMQKMLEQLVARQEMVGRE